MPSLIVDVNFPAADNCRPLSRRLTRRAVHPRIRDLAGPGLEMRFHLRPGGKAPAGDRVPLDIGDAALVLALGARAIRRTSPDPETAVPGKCMQPWMQHHLAAGRIMMQNQCLAIVEQNFPRHAAEGAERALQSVEPTVLPLMSIRPHMQPTRVAEGCDEEKDFDRNTIDLNPALAEVDLQLLARLRLEPHRRTCRGNQLPAQRCRRTLDRPQADDDALLGCQLLANYIGVAGMATKPLGEPVGQSIQLLRP
jgi:hypothetical protein